MQKRFSGGMKEWLLMILGALLLLAALFLPLRFALADEWSTEERQLMAAYENNEIIRIHVIANSDSNEDQALKLKVRDALIDAFGEMLAKAGAQSSDAVYRLLTENMEVMRQTAAECIHRNGCSDSIQAETGSLHLPEKRYGNVLLPEGAYRALRITIGEGNGQNWWCVLYPQLCLALSETEESQTLWTSKRIFSQWLLLGH